MSRWVAVLVVAAMAFLLAGAAVLVVSRLRSDAADVACKENLRGLGLFAARHAAPQPGAPPPALEIPAGTVPNRALKPEDRLSWYAAALPWMDQRRQPAASLHAQLEFSRSWTDGPNAAVSRTRLPALMCPAMPPVDDPARPAVANYVGIAGLGADAATLAVSRATANLGAFGTWPVWRVSPRAGCFRYDAPTPFEAIADGLSETLLLGEREPGIGAWLQGGPSTVRGVDDDEPKSPPRVGPGGQFGGGHAVAANFAFADGSVRAFTFRVDARVFDAMATIAGREAETLRLSE